ncbi:uroporphyrinogen decarboxylase, partial [Candidatus Bathyarchaeota archaeon]|nr:uroporphyrinogen decarboxylase [Candidatus Bathyarchaeota archaeon]
NKDKFFVAGAGLLFFERAWAMRGFRQILIDFYRHPDFVEELLDNLMELNLQIIEGIVQYDVDAVLFSDDYGAQKGLIMNPNIWRRFLKPRLKQMYKEVKKAGKLVMIHSCGDNSEIMRDLTEIGVDIFNPTQPEAMDIYELKKKWGSQITFDGGITTQKLPFYTPEQIREEVRRTRSIMSKGGGFILEPAKEIRWDIPPETAIALIKEITNPSE